VPSLAEPLQDLPVPGVARPVLHVLRTRLEQGREVVQHKQDAPRLQQLQQLPQTRFLIRVRQHLLVGQEQDRPGQPLGRGRGVAHAPPVHRLEVSGSLARQPGGQAGLADAAHSHDRDQPAAVIHDPAAEGRQLLGPPVQRRDVRCLTPVLPTGP
jgi:hypothetical protein